MADDDRTITEEAHIALMTHAVATKTVELAAEKDALETKVSELSGKVDVLEAEKAALETKVSELNTNFDEYKADVERSVAVEAAKAERVAAVKAANDKLPEAYFTDERIKSWAEMDAAIFAVVLDGIQAAGASAPAPGSATRETAAFSGGVIPSSDKAPKASVGKFLAARSGN